MSTSGILFLPFMYIISNRYNLFHFKCLSLQDKMYLLLVQRKSQVLVPRRWRQQLHTNCLQLPSMLHGAISQMAVSIVFAEEKASLLCILFSRAKCQQKRLIKHRTMQCYRQNDVMYRSVPLYATRQLRSTVFVKGIVSVTIVDVFCVRNSLSIHVTK